MKTTIKIFILCIACVLAIGGIMIYAKTRVAPPAKVESINQFEVDLKDGFDAITKENQMAQIDSTYEVIFDRIIIYSNENKISSKQNDDDINKLLDIYTPMFLNTCFSKFNASVWYESDHKWMKERIDVLSGVRLSDNSVAIRQETQDSLHLVNDIIKKYNSAKTLCGSHSYNGISGVRSTINAAERYTKDPYLSNNEELMSSLRQIKGRLHDSHFNYVTNQVRRLEGYRSMSESYFLGTLVPQVEGIIKEYDNNAASLYGNKRSTDQLWTKARTLCKDAVDYFENQKK